MSGVWRKTHTPHPNGRWKTMQKQNRTPNASSLVAAVKPPHPHKEKKNKAMREVNF
jgi:hypothetical protein